MLCDVSRRKCPYLAHVRGWRVGGEAKAKAGQRARIKKKKQQRNARVQKVRFNGDWVCAHHGRPLRARPVRSHGVECVAASIGHVRELLAHVLARYGGALSAKRLWRWHARHAPRARIGGLQCQAALALQQRQLIRAVGHGELAHGALRPLRLGQVGKNGHWGLLQILGSKLSSNAR